MLNCVGRAAKSLIIYLWKKLNIVNFVLYYHFKCHQQICEIMLDMIR